MRRAQLFVAVGVSLCSALVTGSQATPPVALSEALRARVKNERLDIVTSVRGLPLGVREGLQALFGSASLDISDPTLPFDATGTAGNPTLPIRRLVTAGCSIEYCLVYYERGGATRTWQVALFHWAPEATRFEWGGSAPGGLATIDDVRSAVVSGAIKSPNRVW